MNSKIKEFAKLSGFHFHNAGYSPTEHTLPLEYSEECFNRFAELILKEVFNVCDDVCDVTQNPEWRICEEFGMDHDWRTK